MSGSLIGTGVLVTLPEILRFIGIPNTIAPNMRQIIYGAVDYSGVEIQAHRNFRRISFRMSALVLENVSKAFAGIHAVKHVSLTLEKNSVTALIGPNGAGKTTLFNLICGFVCPDQGAIYYHDKNITCLAPWRIARMGLGRLFQDIHLFDRLTVRENILTAFPDQKGARIRLRRSSYATA